MNDETKKALGWACTHMGPWPEGLACLRCYLDTKRALDGAQKEAYDAHVRAGEIIPL